MTFRPAPGCVLVDMEFDKSSFVPSAQRNYERMGKVIGLPHDKEELFAVRHAGIHLGDIICFDEYGYRRFTLNENTPEETSYTVVDVDNGALWGIIKDYASTTSEPVQA